MSEELIPDIFLKKVDTDELDKLDSKTIFSIERIDDKPGYFVKLINDVATKDINSIVILLMLFLLDVLSPEEKMQASKFFQSAAESSADGVTVH